MIRNQKIGEKRIVLRNQLFPHITEAELWHRKRSAGFTTIPRTMPLFLALMDRLSKGKPVSAVYLELWCRMFDESFINLKPREMAFHAGFSGQRAEQTWSERMKILQKLGFIAIQPGPEGDLSYAVVLNPYKVVKAHFKKKTDGLDTAAYNALMQRATEIGASDLVGPPPRESVVIVGEKAKTIRTNPPTPQLPSHPNSKTPPPVPIRLPTRRT